MCSAQHGLHWFEQHLLDNLNACTVQVQDYYKPFKTANIFSTSFIKEAVYIHLLFVTAGRLRIPSIERLRYVPHPARLTFSSRSLLPACVVHSLLALAHAPRHGNTL